MNNSDFEATPEAVEYAESDYTDWVNYLPEDTLRERIIKRVLVQNMKYGLEIIHILKSEVAKDYNENYFANVINNLRLFTLSVEEPIMHRAMNIRVFKGAFSKSNGIARIAITKEYDAIKTRLHFSKDKQRLEFYEGVQLPEESPIDDIKTIFYDIQKKVRLSDDIYSFLDVWQPIMKQMGRSMIEAWQINKVFFLDCDESFEKYDIRFNIFIRENMYMELHILKRDKFWLVAGQNWDYVYRVCELDSNFNIAIKELVSEYLLRNVGYGVISFMENIENVKANLCEISDYIFDLDDSQLKQLYKTNYAQSIVSDCDSIENNYQDSINSIMLEINGNADLLFEELLPMFDTEEKFRERWGVENVFCTRKVFNDSGILQFEPAFTFVARGYLFEGIVSITACAPNKYFIHLFDMAHVFMSKWECDTTKCRLESMLDIIINCGYLGNNVRNLVDERFEETMYIGIKYFRSTDPIDS